MKKSKKMWFIHHFILIWMSIIISPIYFFISLIKLTNERVRNNYKKKIRDFKKKVDLYKFLNKVKDNLTYTNDGSKFYPKSFKEKLQGIINGLLHHYNTLLEIFVRGLDCEDYAFFVAKYIKKFYGIKTYVFGIIGRNIFSFHYDCFFEYNGNLIISNQGHYILIPNNYRIDNENPKEYWKSIINYITNSNHYMNGWYNGLKDFWICKW